MIGTRTLGRFALGMGLIGSLGLRCGGSGSVTPTGPTTATVRKCDVTLDTFDSPITSTTIEKPTNCPVSIPYAGYPVSLSSYTTFDPGSTSGAEFSASVHDANGFRVDDGLTRHGSTSVNSLEDDWLRVSGRYRAGSAGFAVPNRTDRAYTIMEKPGARYTATGLLTYVQGPASASVNAPADVAENTQIPVMAGLHDPDAIPPVSWSWKLNGSPIGVTTQDFTWPSGQERTSSFFEVVVTDGRGISHTASVQVWTRCNDPTALGCSAPNNRMPAGNSSRAEN